VPTDESLGVAGASSPRALVTDHVGCSAVSARGAARTGSSAFASFIAVVAIVAAARERTAASVRHLSMDFILTKRLVDDKYFPTENLNLFA
jgi:hypothetical protein